MKLHLALIVLVLIALAKFHSCEANNVLDDDYIDRLIKHPKKDDNIVNGNNKKGIVQINGHTISKGNAVKMETWLNSYIVAQVLYVLMRSYL